MEAVQHLRAAGLNDPADNLEKMAREMREHIEREDREGSDGKMFGRMEEMQKEIRSLSSQVQELRSMMKARGGDQQAPVRRPDGPRDGDRRDGNADGPPRRPDGPPHSDQHGKDGGGRQDDRDKASRENPPGEPRNQGPRDEAKRDGAPRDGGVRNSPPKDGPPRGDAKRDSTPRDDAHRDSDRKEGARAESSAGSGHPSVADRERFMGLSDRAREKFSQEMRERREKMINSTPEERMKAAKELFDRIEAEDKAKRSESRAAEDGLRALEVKPPL